MEYLIKLLFTSKGKNKLDKADFYKIFGNLLPSSEDKLYKTQSNPYIIAESNINNNINNENNNININNKEINNNINTEKEETQPPINNESIIKPENNNNISNNNTEININIKKDKSLEDIGQLVLKFTSNKKNYSEAVDLFKNIFDKDASLGIDKDELFKGFKKMEIILNNKELDILWKKMSGNKGIIDFSSFKAFHENYCKIEIIKDDNNIENNNNMTGTQKSEPFLTNNPD